MLIFPIPADADLESIRRATRTGLADYRAWREHLTPRQVATPPYPVLTHLFRRLAIPRGVSLADRSVSDVAVHGGRWHGQIVFMDAPKYYVRLRSRADHWWTEWFGEAYTVAIETAYRWLLDRESEYRGHVDLLSTRVYKFSAFRIRESDTYVIASSRRRDRKFLPLLEPMTGTQLGQRLLDRFGEHHGSAGISDGGTG